MTKTTNQLAIIGAGPYGLAAAAHLRAAGVETTMFGEDMDFWEKQMPAGMFLRSSWEASHISSPGKSLSLDEYATDACVSISKPIPLESFIDYGRWFRKRVAPDLDRRRVTKIERDPKGFLLTLDDEKTMRFRRVVVATGISSFGRRPSVFEGLPLELVSHTSEHRDLAKFAGKRVIIIGGGQSALETAALLCERGADVELIVRQPGVHWLDQKVAWLKSEKNPLRPIFYPPTDVGPPGLNWIVATPGLFRRLPRKLQDKIAHRSIRPAGAGWLLPRVCKVRITTRRIVREAAAGSGAINLRLCDGQQRTVDHVMLATGYQVDVARYGFIAPGLLKEMRVAGGYPILTEGLESSVAGLHFLGAPAAHSFGPLCRFVAGTPFTAAQLTRRIAGKRAAAVQWNCF